MAKRFSPIGDLSREECVITPGAATMRAYHDVVLRVLVTCLVIPACISTMPRTWDAETGEVDCPVAGPIIATAAAVVLPVSSVGEFRFKPEPPMYDQYGYQTNASLSPEVHHAIGLALVGAGAIAAGVAVIEWLSHARCRRLDAPMRALVAARDCATVVRRVGELDAIDPGIRFTLSLRNPDVAKCLKAAEPPASLPSPPPTPLSPAEEDCHRRRRLASQAAQDTSDLEERTKILTHLPDCSKVAPPPSP